VKDDVSLPEKVTLSVPQPKEAELYYDTCGKIDQHNKDRQAMLGLEVKLKTQGLSKRVGLTIHCRWLESLESDSNGSTWKPCGETKAILCTFGGRTD
jgi:hypothetical protein